MKLNNLQLYVQVLMQGKIMNSFEITRYGTCGGDQCSPYYIEVSPSATVRSVIKDILSNKIETIKSGVVDKLEKRKC